MANDDLGRCDCPVCSGEAVVRVNKKGRAYVMCSGCSFQGFARSSVSDNALRGRIKNGNGVDSGGAGAAVDGGVGSGAKNDKDAGDGVDANKASAAAITQAKKPAQQKAPVMHTADGQEVPGAAPAVPEFNLIDGLAGFFRS